MGRVAGVLLGELVPSRDQGPYLFIEKALGPGGFALLAKNEVVTVKSGYSSAEGYDNALAETIIGLFKIAIIWPLGPWESSPEVEIATFEWVDGYNSRRLFSFLHYKTQIEVEQAYSQHQLASDTLDAIT